MRKKRTVGQAENAMLREKHDDHHLQPESDLQKTEAIKRIILCQLDLEVLYKLREAKVIEEELERGERIRELLEKMIINGK